MSCRCSADAATLHSTTRPSAKPMRQRARATSPTPKPPTAQIREPTQSATLDFQMLKIDVFPHILPRPFFDRLIEVAPRGGLMVKRVQNIPVMIDIEKRFEIMDRHEGYVQVLTLAAARECRRARAFG